MHAGGVPGMSCVIRDSGCRVQVGMLVDKSEACQSSSNGLCVMYAFVVTTLAHLLALSSQVLHASWAEPSRSCISTQLQLPLLNTACQHR